MLFLCVQFVLCHNATGNEKNSPSTQPAITCSKLTTEALEQGVEYVQS